jgi:NADPH:quinone reductase-like Zn-dependent oxidoreductase
MKAVICTGYGAPEVLQLQEVPTPTPKDNELLIRIIATAVNSGEVRIRKADPWAVKLMFGWSKPKNAILGVSLSGEITAIWKDVTKFKVGDQVFWNTDMSFGAYAEYKCMSEDGALAIKPEGMTHAEAASIPFGGTTALAFLRKWGVKSGDKVLIYGASGSVGNAAVQIAKSMWAHVTGVCSTANIEMVKSLWADEVIDYTTQDFSENGVIYDIIMDSVGKMNFSKWVKSLSETGSLILNSAMPADMMKWLWLTMTSKRKVAMWGFSLTAELMDYLKWLIETSQMRATIDRTYTLDQIVEAHAYVEKWHKSGNVVVEISK